MLCDPGSVLYSLGVTFPIYKIIDVNDLPFMIAPNLTFSKAKKVNNQDAKNIDCCPLKKQCIKSFNEDIFNGTGN